MDWPRKLPPIPEGNRNQIIARMRQAIREQSLVDEIFSELEDRANDAHREAS